MIHGTLSYVGHDAPTLRSGESHGAIATSDATLVRALRHAGGAGDFTSADALAGVAAFARRAHRAGSTTPYVTATVRRSFAAAAPGSMTVVAYDALARCLVRHALYVLHGLASGREPASADG